MKYTRWYDKDKKLQMIVKTIESIDDKNKFNMAVDIIQMVMISRGIQTDEFINKINKMIVDESNRWYDRDETIQFAVEMLQHTDEIEREELLQEIFYGLMQLEKQSDKEDS